MTSNKEISVLLPVRNGATTIKLAIQSILAQTFKEFELIILDDGSTDDTLLIIDQIKDERIVVIADGMQKGITARLNEGLEKAKGNWIARMDADDIAYPQRFEKQVNFLRTHPQIDLIGTSMLVIRNNMEVLGKRVVPVSHKEIIQNPMRGFPLMHPTFMGKKSWFEKFRYEVCLGSEDQDLLLRSYKQSRFSNLDEILFAYRENKIEPEKYRKGRASYLHSLLKTGHIKSQTFKHLFQRGFNKVKNFRDKIAMMTSLEYKLLTNRAAPVNTSDREQFLQVLSQLNVDQVSK